MGENMRDQLKELLNPTTGFEVSREYGVAEIMNALNCEPYQHTEKDIPSLGKIFETIKTRSPERESKRPIDNGIELAKEHLKLTLQYREAQSMSSSMPEDDRSDKMSSVTQLYARRLAKV